VLAALPGLETRTSRRRGRCLRIITSQTVYIGEVKADGQFNVVWEIRGTVPGDAWSTSCRGARHRGGLGDPDCGILINHQSVSGQNYKYEVSPAAGHGSHAVARHSERLSLSAPNLNCRKFLSRSASCGGAFSERPDCRRLSRAHHSGTRVTVLSQRSAVFSTGSYPCNSGTFSDQRIDQVRGSPLLPINMLLILVCEEI